MRKWLANAMFTIVAIVLTPIELVACTIGVLLKTIGTIVLVFTGNKTILTTLADIDQTTIDAVNSALKHF